MFIKITARHKLSNCQQQRHYGYIVDAGPPRDFIDVDKVVGNIWMGKARGILLVTD